MKKIKLSIVGVVVSGLALSSCSLVQTPGTREMKNLKVAKPIVVEGSEGFASKLAAAGSCDRGVAEIDVMHDVGAFAKHEGAIFASGKAYFTSKPWSHEEANAFHALGYEKGEPTFPYGADVEIPYLANAPLVVAKFFNGSKASKNMIDNGEPIEQAKGIGLEAILEAALDQQRRNLVKDDPETETDVEGDDDPENPEVADEESDDEDTPEADNEPAPAEEAVAVDPSAPSGLYLDRSYSIELTRGEGDRLQNYYLGNLPDSEGHVEGFGQRTSQGKAVVYGEETTGFGVGDFTHFSFGKPGLGYGLYMVPADVESATQTLGTVISAVNDGALEFVIGERSAELPPATKAAYITVTLEHANKQDKLNPVRYHVEDTGQTTIGFSLAGVAPGTYKMVVQRAYLYSSPVQDEKGGNLCVLAGAAASSQVNVTAPAAK